MGKFMHTQNSFANGEVANEFFARGDMATASCGLSRLLNMDVLPSGAITRRAGTVRMFETHADSMLVSMSVSDNENYLLVMHAGHIKIYNGETLVQDLLAPWSADELKNIQYAQRFGTMIFVHPGRRPVVLRKIGESSFSLNDFEFSRNDNMTENIPFIRFDDSDGIKLSITTHPSGNSYATVTASSTFWKPTNVGGTLMFLGKQWVITEYVSPTVITAMTNGTYPLPGAPVSDWKEAAFSTRRGWPRSITFHQDRLVFGGSRDWPCGVWMSKVGDHMNFDVGTGLDDEAIFLTLLSSTRQQICTVASSDNLQILTTTGEWAITAKPLTPATIDIKQHTSVGSCADRYLPPQKVEGCTVFVSRTNTEIRELVLDDLAQTYSAVDLCALSSHLMKLPTGIAYHDESHRLFVTMSDGSIAVLTKIAPLSISAWAEYKTQGEFKSVAVMNDEIFVIVTRDIGTFVERFSKTTANDSGGFGFAFAAAGMPLFASGHPLKKLHLTKISARVLDTKSVFFKIGTKEFRAPLPNEVQKPEAPGYSGDVSVSLLGTNNDTMKPLWAIEGSEPLPCTILSITAEGRYSI
ncbi:MAG: hypothetical protein LBJ18_04495 [Rickettsiales bacterium]|jgi:hypothetical protein|nr:hypothetical protein [Rickettsiales bacterium]